MALSYFSSEALHSPEQFGLALLVSESPDVSMFDENVQGDILARAVETAAKYLKDATARPALGAAKRAMTLLDMLKKTGNTRCVEHDLEKAARKTHPKAAEILLAYLDDKQGLSKLKEKYIFNGDFESAERVSKVLGEELDRNKVRKFGLESLARFCQPLKDKGNESYRIDLPLKAFQYLKEPIVADDKTLASYFRQVAGWATSQSTIFHEMDAEKKNPAYGGLLSVVRAINGMLIEGNKGRREDGSYGLLHLANLAFENGAYMTAARFISAFYKTKGKRYKAAARKCQKIAMSRQEYWIASGLYQDSGDQFPVMEAFGHVLSPLSSNSYVSPKSNDKSRNAIYSDRSNIILNIRVLSEIASPEELSQMRTELEKLIEDSEKTLLSQGNDKEYVGILTYYFLLNVRIAQKDKPAIKAALEQAVERRYLSYNLVKCLVDTLGKQQLIEPDESRAILSKSYAQMHLERLPVSQRRSSQTEPKENNTRLEDVLDAKLSAVRVVQLYDNQGLTGLGLTRVKAEILSILEYLKGSNIGRGYICLTGNDPGWIQFLEKKLKEGKYALKREDYIAFAGECLSEGNLVSAEGYFTKAAGKEFSHFASHEELKPIIAPYRQEILVALSVALSNPSSMRLYNARNVTETFELLGIDVPPVVYLHEGISELHSCANVNYHHLHTQGAESEKALFEPNSSGIYSVWDNFRKSGDKGMIEFVEKNFPTYIADFKRQEQERLQKQQTGA